MSRNSVKIQKAVNFPCQSAAEQKKITDHEKRYKVDGYYWGIQPSNMGYEVMKLCPPVKPLRLLDVACGEGKNAVFLQESDIM